MGTVTAEPLTNIPMKTREVCGMLAVIPGVMAMLLAYVFPMLVPVLPPK